MAEAHRKRPIMTVRHRRVWLTLHLFFATFLVAGVLSSLILLVIASRSSYPQLEASGHYFVTYLDNFLIVPGSFGSLITGFLLAWRGNWGPTRYYWVLAKLVGTILLILNGSQLIRRELILSISRTAVEHGELSFLHNQAYLQARTMSQVALSGSLLVVFFLIVISTYKPWGKLRSATDSSR